MSFLIGFIKIIFLLGFLITIHEFGHFIVAKKCKVKVKEFAIGFGPKIWQKQGNETIYTLRLIPLGGYCDMLGETERIEEEGAFNKAKISKRIAIVLAGGVVNIVFGILAYFILAAVSGLNVSTTVESLLPEYAENISEIQIGDTIKEINGEDIKLKSDIDKQVQKSNGNNLKLLVERNGELVEIEVTPTKVEHGYVLGIMVEAKEKSLKNNLYYAFWDTIDFTASIGESVKLLITGNVNVNQMTGPIGISNMVVQTSGIYEFVYLLSIISLSLGVTNLLPIPALDGGRIVVLLVEAIRRKPLKETTEMTIQTIGFLFLIFLSIYISYKDILRIF